LTTTKRFLLDNGIFSSIIYIWYEGVRLRPRLVSKQWSPSGRAGPSGGQMAKKAKKAAKKKAAKKKK